MIITKLHDPTRRPLATLLRSPIVYQRWLERRYPSATANPRVPADFPSENGALGTTAEVERAVRCVRDCGLPEFSVREKNWDSLGALGAILRRTGPDARILDAGGIIESVISTWLWLYGYRDLWCINPIFPGPFRHAGIRYEPGDVTRTRFTSETFDAVTCLSVVEHGVDLEAYFRETARILRPGGTLVTSTDYFPEKIDTSDRHAYGVPVKIFTRDEIRDAIHLAATFGLRPTGVVPLDVGEKPVHWNAQNLDFTFVVLTLVKVNAAGVAA